jgi:hemoglobin
MRHMPFPIGSVERDQWLWCMNKSLDESGLDSGLVELLKNRFAEAADFMRNKPEDLINPGDVSSPLGG